MLDINVKDVSLVLEGGTFRTVFTMGIRISAGYQQVLLMPDLISLSKKGEIFRY